jgi:hypothetical protein
MNAEGGPVTLPRLLWMRYLRRRGAVRRRAFQATRTVGSTCNPLRRSDPQEKEAQ